jgi:hypothetical protein
VKHRQDNTLLGRVFRSNEKASSHSVNQEEKMSAESCSQGGQSRDFEYTTQNIDAGVDMENVISATRPTDEFLHLLTELRVIAKLRKVGERLNTNGKTLSIAPATYFSKLARWWNGEHHSTNIPVIRSRLQRAFAVVTKELKQNSKSIRLRRIHKTLKEVAGSLQKLHCAYKKKGLAHACSELEIMIENIIIYQGLVENNRSRRNHINHIKRTQSQESKF